MAQKIGRKAKSLLTLITSPIYPSESDMKINEPSQYFKQGYFDE